MNSSLQSLPPSYDLEAVCQIVNIALAKQSDIGSELSDAKLLEIAQELNISPDSIELAKSQCTERQKLAKKHQQFELYRRAKLQDRLSKYAIVNACLIPLNLLTGFVVPWSLYVLISWGIVRGVGTWQVLFQHQGYAYNRAFQKWERQQTMPTTFEN
jgi:2TM domain